MTSTSRKPRRRASSTSSYWRRWLSRLVWTWVCVDCLTYTTALRFRTVAGRRSAPVIAVLLHGSSPAACIRRLARRTTILWRSGGCILHICGARTRSASWRGPSGRALASIGSCRRFIGLLLGDSDFAGGASPKTAINEEPDQILERRDIDRAARRAACRRRPPVKHPARHDDHHAGSRLDVSSAARLPVPRYNAAARRRPYSACQR